ncbi:DnaA regulatory inactivator Hda [Luteimonas sp. MJ204]|uniref:DnaA regulatory inactivator Hda n=1 Tax=Luteimonas sp. MJ145 TaxID=3129234 RepID=UPI0031BB47C4
MNRQLPLALRYPPDQRFDTFVDAPAAAIGQLRMLAAGSGDWLYLDGAAGTGKTHLALAACAQADAMGRRATYLPLALAAGRLHEALESLGDGPGLVALDGLEAIAGRGGDEVALFEFHNRARAAGGSVLYAASAAPAALPPGLPDLRSRLAQCVRIPLQPLDDAGRAQVLRLRARRRGLQFDEAAIGWLLRRAGRDLAGLTTQLDALDRASLAAQRRVTVPFLREVLGPNVGPGPLQAP